MNKKTKSKNSKLEEFNNGSLYMDDLGSVYLAGSEVEIGQFNNDSDGNVTFLGYGDDTGITEFTGDQIDQLARLKALWVNQ